MRDHLTDAEMALLREVEDAGVTFMFFSEGCTIPIDSETIPIILKDPEAFEANYLGVSVEQLRRWRAFHEDYRCKAMTAKGRPCSLRPISARGPAEFIPGVSDYCKVHQEHI